MYYYYGIWIYLTEKSRQIGLIYPVCKTRERIPRKIVEFLDEADQIGVDTSISPRFDCEKCYGKMVQFFYIDVKGKIHEYKEN